MGGERDGRGVLRPSFHLYLLVFTLTIFVAQIPLGLFAAQSPLDSTAHVLLPAAATSLLHDLIYRRARHGPAEYFWTMLSLGVGTEMVWEVLEFAGDTEFGLGWQIDNTDTMNDIICGIVGALLGAGIRLALWWRTRPASPGTIGTRRTAALVGAVAVVVLAPSTYVGYLLSTMPPASPTAPTFVIAAAALTPRPARAPEPSVATSVPVPSLGTPVPVGPTPGFVVAAPHGRQVYVANRAAGVVTVVDTAVDRVTATIPVPLGPPQFLAFSPDGRAVYVSVWDEARTVAAIAVLDTTSNAVVATVPMRSRPFLAAVTPDGRRLYVPNHDSATVAIVDTASRTVTAEIRVAADPHWVEFSPDGTRAYTANHESNLVSVIDTTTDTVVAEVPAGRSPHSVAVHPTRPLVADVDYGSDSVTVIDTDAERVVAAVPVGDGPQDLTWAADGRHAYVVNVEEDTVSVVDAAAMAVTATIPTGDAPTSVAVLPDGRQAYVSNLRDGTLTVLHTADPV